MSCHTTTPKILDTFIISLVLILEKKHARPLDFFLTFLAQQKFKRQGSSDPTVLIKFYPYLITTPKVQINHTLVSYPESLTTQLLFITQSFCSILFSQHQIYSSHLRPFAPHKSSCQSPCRVVIHTTHEESSLNNRDCAPSLKPIHQDPFAITCKTIKQTKNKSKNKFFDVIEASHCQQFNH